jgi:O-acetyl-ADP-ribose deacetylase (regulator of RNase III)
MVLLGDQRQGVTEMIEYRRGDILTADVEALVNTVNCVGIMGRGIALQVKNAYPANFEIYQEACTRGEVQPGRMLVSETGSLTNPQYIVNFPTKRHWRGKSRLEDIEIGLEELAREIRRRRISSIAVPPLGSGLGGLRWDTVRPRIESVLAGLPDVRVIVYEPNESPVVTASPEIPSMTPGRAAMIVLVNKYLEALMDPFISLLEIHKLMYFMQESGEPLRLRYIKGPYGPYAENLRHVLRAIEGYFISGYADGGDAPDKQLELVPGAITDATAYLSHNTETRSHFDRVADLVAGFETPFGLELLATVHWVAKHDSPINDAEVVKHTYAWNSRKRAFSERQIRLALEILLHKNWLPTGATIR